jgi:pyruvate/2-oxoglutarate dehydrogenase complex dihydrolipoamide dehydrogenase (E3) component
VHKVEVRLGVTATSDEVLALRPDVVIIATGSVPRPASAAIMDGAGIVAARDVLDGTAQVGRRVVVIAEDPHMTGPTTADFLAGQGCRVRIISPFQTIGDAIDDTLKPIVLQRLLDQGVECLPYYAAAELRPGLVILKHILTGATLPLECDSIVSACGGRAVDDLFHALAGSGPAIHLVGDALAPRRVHDAMLEATRVARAI